MVNIVIICRQQITDTGDFHACIEGSPWHWACGKVPDEAIGNLVRTHPEHFGIKEVKINIEPQ